jgi:hypothetical protein
MRKFHHWYEDSSPRRTRRARRKKKERSRKESGLQAVLLEWSPEFLEIGNQDSVDSVSSVVKKRTLCTHFGEGKQNSVPSVLSVVKKDIRSGGRNHEAKS